MKKFRFAPTIDNGPLHAGHMLCLFTNILFAKKVGGKVFIRLDFYDKKERFFSENVHLLLKLLPGISFRKLIYDKNDFLTRQFMIAKFGYDVSEIETWMQVLKDDYEARVSHIIRGNEYKKGPSAVNGLCHKLSLESLSEVFFLYHPLLCQDGKKLSKSNKSAGVMELSGADGLGWLTYVSSLFAQHDLSPQDAMNFHKTFILHESPNFSFSYEKARFFLSQAVGLEVLYRNYLSDVICTDEKVWW